jgi:ketosteroid isomerase-like protein
MTGHFLSRTGGVLMLALLVGGSALAQSRDQAESEIRAALLKWTTDFNARNVGDVCDLFTPDLRYDFQGFSERGYDDICKLLRASLSDTSKRFTYLPPTIKEIIVSGDLAVVRLTWTLKVRARRRHIARHRPRCLPPTTGRTLEDHSLHRIRGPLIKAADVVGRPPPAASKSKAR